MPSLGKEYTTKGAEGPLTFLIDGEQYEAVPLLPADTFGSFMRVANTISETVPTINDKNKSVEEKTAATEQFIRLTLDGLGLILLPDSVARITERVSSRERPLDLPFIAELFGDLTSYYMGVKEEGEPEDEAEARPTGDGSDSPPSSDTTGTPASEGPSSEKSDATDSTPSTPGT